MQKNDWLVVSTIFGIFIPKLWEMIQFDDHIFQMGWFNHQLYIDEGGVVSLGNHGGLRNYEMPSTFWTSQVGRFETAPREQ